MGARDYFEGIREEVHGIERSRDMIARLRSREGAKAQSYQVSTGGGYSDPMDAVSGRIDFERRLEARIAESNAAIEDAATVLYGRSNRGGLAKLHGNRYADAVCMAYLQAMPWDEIAEVMQCSKQWCRELCNAAFRYIDEAGFAQLKES